MNLRRTAPLLAFGFLLVAGGFAAASIASGGGLRFVSTTGTTGLTGTGPLPSRVTICHHTHSRKHPSHAITISSHAWPAHARHGDTLGPCTHVPTQTGALTKKHGHGHGHGKGHGSQAPIQVTSAQPGNSDHGNQNAQPNQGASGEGHGNGNGNGNGNGHGEGHGHGKP